MGGGLTVKQLRWKSRDHACFRYNVEHRAAKVISKIEDPTAPAMRAPMYKSDRDLLGNVTNDFGTTAVDPHSFFAHTDPVLKYCGLTLKKILETSLP